MKTISELSSKVWYRLLKVLYIIFFIFAIFICFLICSGSGIKRLDPDNTFITCNFNSKHMSVKESGLYLSNYQFDDYQFDYASFLRNHEYDTADVFNICYPGQIRYKDAYLEQRLLEVANKYGLAVNIGMK